jgi:hypothetical protein
MVNNQYKLIKGYRDLTTEEIAVMNEIKHVAEHVRALIGEIRKFPIAPTPPIDGVTSYDHRWLDIAETHLQQGFMALTRSIAKPTTF